MYKQKSLFVVESSEQFRMNESAQMEAILKKKT